MRSLPIPPRSIAGLARSAALAALAVAASACSGAGGAAAASSPSQPPPPKPPPAPTAPALPTTFDGFALGDSFGEVFARAPYDRPCDDDPIEGRRARAMVYGGAPCRGHAFPGGTSVVFIIDYADGDDLARPIRAFGWMGPYYDDKVKLPVRYGQPVAAAAALGPPAASFDLRALHVDQHRGGISVLSDRGTIVGFAFGELPPDPERERWRAFDQMYRRYTPRPGAPGRIGCATAATTPGAQEPCP